MNTDTTVTTPTKKWSYPKRKKKATNYEKKTGRGYTKSPFTKAWRKLRNKKNKAASKQRRKK